MLMQAKSGASLSNRAKKPLSKLSTAMSVGANARDLPAQPKNLPEPLPEVRLLDIPQTVDAPSPKLQALAVQDLQEDHPSL